MPSFCWSVVLGTFAASGRCVAESLSFQNEPLALARCTKSCGGHGSCWRNTCFCFMGWEGENCRFPVTRAGAAVVVPEPNAMPVDLQNPHRMTGGTQWADALDAVDEAAAAIDGVSAATVSVEDARNALSWRHSNMVPQDGSDLRAPFQAQTLHDDDAPFKQAALPAHASCSDGGGVCSGHGKCRLEKCICEPGFRGERCNLLSKLTSEVAAPLLPQRSAQPMVMTTMTTTCDASCTGLGECHPGGLCVCAEEVVHKTRTAQTLLRRKPPSGLTDNMDCIPRQLFDKLMASLLAAEHTQEERHTPDQLVHNNHARAPTPDARMKGPAQNLGSVQAGQKHIFPYSSPTQDPKFIAAGLALVMFAVVVGIGLFLLGGEISKRVDLAKRKSMAQDIVRRSFTPGSGSVSAARFFGEQRLNATSTNSHSKRRGASTTTTRALSRMRLPDLDDML